MTKEIRTVEFVVLPTSKAKARKMFQIAGACRYVWNHFREKNLSDYQEVQGRRGRRAIYQLFQSRSGVHQAKHRTHWLRELPANPIKHTLKYFADALKEAIAGKKGFPKPRSRRRTTPSFTLPSKENFRIKILIENTLCFAMTGTGGVPLSSMKSRGRTEIGRQPGSWC